MLPATLSSSCGDPSVLIDTFAGDHAFLSNFDTTPLRVDGATYASVEHYFNAAKTLDPCERERVRAAPTPALAKKAGRAVTLRPDWDVRVRYEAMRTALAAKFTNPHLRAALLATGTALLIEGNTWHDQQWGTCVCSRHFATPGANHLGRALMALRAELSGQPTSTWTRAAVTGHRPDAFTPAQAAWARGELERLAVKLTTGHHTRVAISGAAMGADTWWANAAHATGLDVWAYIPFETQAATWPTTDQDAWAALRRAATRELVLGAGYDVRLFHARNEFMIRDADVVIAVHDPGKTTGGTASTIAKAQASGKTLVLVDVPGQRTTLREP